MIVHLVIAALLVIFSILAVAGVIMTHLMSDSDGVFLEIGSSQGSLALIAFAITITLTMKHIVKCCAKCEICK